jgi:hypothetical protein
LGKILLTVMVHGFASLETDIICACGQSSAVDCSRIPLLFGFIILDVGDGATSHNPPGINNGENGNSHGQNGLRS